MSFFSTISQGDALRFGRTLSHYRRTTGTRYLTIRCNIGDGIKKFFDDIAFEKWAPRSSRAWRLGQLPTTSKADSTSQNLMWESLEREVANQKYKMKQQFEISTEKIEITKEGEGEDNQIHSFLDSSDDTISDSFNQKLSSIKSEDDFNDPIDIKPLTANELRSLIKIKYGKTCDMTFAKRKVLGKNVVVLNIMWMYLEQQSFPMTESEYMDKLEYICTLVNMWERTKQVRSFLSGPIKSKVGHHSRPIIGMAVSVPLDLPASVIDKWFPISS